MKSRRVALFCVSAVLIWPNTRDREQGSGFTPADAKEQGLDLQVLLKNNSETAHGGICPRKRYRGTNM